jgi:opacity protein-like surface antigen
LLVALAAAPFGEARAADWPGADVLRGSYSAPVRWDGVNFGVQLGAANMTTDFGNSTGSLVAYILRNTIVEAEYSPSSWTTLPKTTTTGRSYGAFLGYSAQWDQLVLGVDLAYNRASNMEASATDSMSRQFSTSDGFYNHVTVNASSSAKLIDYGTFRGRAGYAIGQFLPYALVGVAVGRFNYASTANVISSGTDVSGGGGSPYSTNDTQTNAKNNAFTAGAVAGLGLDMAIMPNVFLRAEFEYIAFAPINGIRNEVKTGRIGVGVRF